MKSFLEKYRKMIWGATSGMDRVCFRGTQRLLANTRGMTSYMSFRGILLKNFGAWVSSLTKRVRASCEQAAREKGRPVEYLRSCSVSKEELAKRIAERDGIRSGLICAFSVVEPCVSFAVEPNRSTKKLEPAMRTRKCVWVYHYWNHPEYGFCHLRMQTWLPLTVKGCINGRHWLGRQLDKEGIRYCREANGFTWIEDMGKAQELLDAQLKTDWQKMLNSMLDELCPAYRTLFGKDLMPHYWSADETEWATDVLFKRTADLARIYPQLIQHGVSVFDSPNVLRFLGRKVTAQGQVYKNLTETEVCTDMKRRPEGVRIKHSVNRNCVKMYDKHGSILRVETTINNTREFKVFRHPNDDQHKKANWQKMRKGVADLHRRAHVSQACNERYLDAVADAPTGESLRELFADISQRAAKKGKTYRAINLWKEDDQQLLRSIPKGQYAINGFRNRDMRQNIFPDIDPSDKMALRRASGKITRRLMLLRAHGLIRKVPKTHRYVVTKKGHRVVSALILAGKATVEQLTELAA
jgi:hypothetical protein